MWISKHRWQSIILEQENMRQAFSKVLKERDDLIRSIVDRFMASRSGIVDAGVNRASSSDMSRHASDTPAYHPPAKPNGKIDLVKSGARMTEADKVRIKREYKEMVRQQQEDQPAPIKLP